MVKFWVKLVSEPAMLSSKMYKYCYHNHYRGVEMKWITYVKDILYRNGLGYIWENQTVPNGNILTLLQQRLRDQFIQNWHANINESSLASFYSILKHDFEYENYLNFPSYERVNICKLKCSNHKLPIETGRWREVRRDQRLCDKCNLSAIGDEYHFLLVCPFFSDLRSKFIPTYYWRYPSVNKLRSLFAGNRKTLSKLALFIQKGLNHY